MSFCWFCHEAAQMLFMISLCKTRSCIIELLHWYRWILSRVGIWKDASLRASVDIQTRAIFTDIITLLLYSYKYFSSVWAHKLSFRLVWHWKIRLSVAMQYVYKKVIWAASWQNQQNGMCTQQDSDQLGHPPSLIRVFAVHLKKAWVLSYPLSTLRRLWSDWADAQANLRPHWAHMPFRWFCHDAAHINFALALFCSETSDVSYLLSVFDAENAVFKLSE